MEGRKLILGLRANVGGKCSDRAGIVCLEFGKGFQVRCCAGPSRCSAGNSSARMDPTGLSAQDRQLGVHGNPLLFCKFGAHNAVPLVR